MNPGFPSGIVVFNGTAANTFSGSLIVDDAICHCHKPDGLIVIAVPGALDIGTAGDPDGFSSVVLLAADQINPASVVRIIRAVTDQSLALLDLNGHAQMLGGLEMTHGLVITDNGTLTLNGDLTTLDTGLEASLINGRVVSQGTRTWTVSASAGLHDLIAVNVSVLPGGKVLKQGPGFMEWQSGSSGSLEIVQGSARLTSSPGVIVHLAGGTLRSAQSCGDITSLAAGGTIANGNVPTQRLFTSLLALNAATQINRSWSGSGGHMINVSGAVTLGSAALNLTWTGPGTPVMGSSFRLIDKQSVGPVSGSFAGKPQNAVFPLALAPGSFLQISCTGGDGNNVTLTVVPQPPQICGGRRHHHQRRADHAHQFSLREGLCGDGSGDGTHHQREQCARPESPRAHHQRCRHCAVGPAIADEGFYPANGHTFHIVTNDGTDAVDDTFAGKRKKSAFSRLNEFTGDRPASLDSPCTTRTPTPAARASPCNTSLHSWNSAEIRMAAAPC